MACPRSQPGCSGEKSSQAVPDSATTSATAANPITRVFRGRHRKSKAPSLIHEARRAAAAPSLGALSSLLVPFPFLGVLFSSFPGRER